jgi:hypothetical protein
MIFKNLINVKFDQVRRDNYQHTEHQINHCH